MDTVDTDREIALHELIAKVANAIPKSDFAGSQSLMRLVQEFGHSRSVLRELYIAGLAPRTGEHRRRWIEAMEQARGDLGCE